MKPFTTKFPHVIHSPEAAVDRMAGVLSEVIPGWEKNPSTQDTAMRFVKYLAEFRQPFDEDEIFGSVFEAEDANMIVQVPIPFRMVCEHHLLPALGTAALGYVPNSKVLGLSKLTRLIDAVGTEKPSLQEHIAHRVVDLMWEKLAPKGIMLTISSAHGCMGCRGVRAPATETITSNVKGVFLTEQSAREEFLALIQGRL